MNELEVISVKILNLFMAMQHAAVWNVYRYDAFCFTNTVVSLQYVLDNIH